MFAAIPALRGDFDVLILESSNVVGNREGMQPTMLIFDKIERHVYSIRNAANNDYCKKFSVREKERKGSFRAFRTPFSRWKQQKPSLAQFDGE